MKKHTDIAVIGGGPAGLAAALAAKKEAPDKDVLVIERDRALGGILQQCIHNGFGLHFFGEELTGPEYAGRFISQLDGSGISVMTDTMVLDLTKEKTIRTVSAAEGFLEIEAGAVILAMGCRERTRGALNIPGFRPAGVYTAGCAQRLVNMEGLMPGRRVVILGSGDIGLIMARRLTWEGAKVELVAEIMPYSSGLNRNIVQCLHDNGIPLKFNHTVTNILGKERVEGVVVSEVDPATRRPIPGTDVTYPCDTLLLSVGLIPENELTTQADILMDRVTGGAIVDENRQTSIPGIFACGNVLHVHDLVDNVSDEAVIAGTAAARYLNGSADSCEKRAVTAGRGVRYTVPQRVSASIQDRLDVYFRVTEAFKPAALSVICGGEVIYSRKKQVMTPGEMEKITLDAEKITGDITLCIGEVSA